MKSTANQQRQQKAANLKTFDLKQCTQSFIMSIRVAALLRSFIFLLRVKLILLDKSMIKLKVEALIYINEALSKYE